MSITDFNLWCLGFKTALIFGIFFISLIICSVSRTWITEGELRLDKHGVTVYHYAINLGGHLDTSFLPSTSSSKCGGNTAVCQYKDNWTRKIAETSSNSPTYVMAGMLNLV